VAANALSGFEFGAKVGENPRLLPRTKPEGDHFSAPRLSVELPLKTSVAGMTVFNKNRDAVVSRLSVVDLPGSSTGALTDESGTSRADFRAKSLRS
jgi:hypothetical protein